VKFSREIPIIALFLLGGGRCYSQSFLNLNFEAANNLPPNLEDGELVPTPNALPYWVAFDATTPLLYISYVTNFLNTVSGPVELDGGSLALSGNYSAGLYDGGSISQTGTVPAGTEALEFEASSPLSLEVTLGGQALSYSALTASPGYTIYGANIPTDMDGQVEELSFLCQGGGSGQVVLDNIEFSPMSVPEPSESALIGLGTILLRFCRRRKSG
jgi:hypothetical protein